MACMFPDRVTRICAMSVGWQPAELPTPGLEQSRRYWYQWFMATDRGEEFVHKNGKALARDLWETWAPKGWFSDTEFETTAKSFENPDWPAITVHSYRVRWAEAEKDPRYSALDARAKSVRKIALPTLMIQGGADGVTLAAGTGGKDEHFSGGYARHVLDGVGHFPTRERPDVVAKLLIDFLK
jgi:pimeloyl-ACP methyl ester carboxylesterase